MITALAVGIVVEWVILMVVLPIAQKLADFALPELKDMAWKLLLIIVASTAVSAGLGIIAPLLGTIGSLIVFWIGMVKVFDVDLFGAVIIVVIRMLLMWLIGATLVGLLLSV